MKQISLSSALADCTESCRWCVNHCADYEKYEILVTCISIQKEFLLIGRTINSMLGIRSIEMIEKILKLFEFLSFNIQKKQDDLSKSIPETNESAIDHWMLPGCSHIFEIALSLERFYLDETLNDE